MADEQKEYSRPASFEDLKKVIQSLNEQHAEYLLIGGYALAIHGYHRATEDIDLLIPASAKTSRQIIQGLLILEDGESENLDPAWFEEGENLRLADEVVVDLLFMTNGETYETLQPHVETLEVDGIAVRTLNLEGLLKTKQGDRPKDQMDRVVIERALRSLQNNESL